MPYGVFFVYGRRFKGFHVRFRDIARGGCRVVAPLGIDQHTAESSRTFNEAYSLVGGPPWHRPTHGGKLPHLQRGILPGRWPPSASTNTPQTSLR
eukprot:6672748-Pyramimonas_sp.AAC.2